jgi:hypothetical protein
MNWKAGIALVAGLTILQQSALAVDIATWTFDVTPPTSAGPLNADVGTGVALGSHASGATVYDNPVGNGTSDSWSSNNWAIGDYYQFSVSTTGLMDVMFQWDQTSSNTGPRDFQVQYSTDGSLFTNFGAAYQVLANAAPNGPWSSGTYRPIYTFLVDLSGVAALDNQANIYLRLTNTSTVSANGGTVATTGTDRVDTVKVSATEIPEPGTLALAAFGALAIFRRRK